MELNFPQFGAQEQFRYDMGCNQDWRRATFRRKSPAGQSSSPSQRQISRLPAVIGVARSTPARRTPPVIPFIRLAFARSAPGIRHAGGDAARLPSMMRPAVSAKRWPGT